jgi:anti-anti-sigma factor
MTRVTAGRAGVSSETLGAGTEAIALGGEFDLSNTPEVERRVAAAIDRAQGDIVVDLRGVRFLDSGMLLVLLRGLRGANKQGRRFALVRPPAVVWRVFVLTGFSERFPAYASLSDALADP